MKNWMIGLILLLPTLLRAEFLETSNIEDVFSKVDKETLVLLNMTDTISDSVLSLGSKPWRHFIHSNLKKFQNLDQAGNLHDWWTYDVATKIPVKPVQKEIVTWIETLQKNETPVFCATGRGRNVWYCTIINQVDDFTDFQLQKIGIDFTKTKVPEELQNLDPKYFHHGVFYTDPYALGEFIDKILQETGYRPKKIVVVNDKRSELQSADQARLHLPRAASALGWQSDAADRARNPGDPLSDRHRRRSGRIAGRAGIPPSTGRWLDREPERCRSPHR